MVGVSYCGRLGNQLFQFHFFQYLKQTNPKKRIYLLNPGHTSIYKYFDLSSYNYTGSNLSKLLGKLLYKFGNFKEKYITNLEVPKQLVPTDGTLYHGFHQTDFYLKNTPHPVPIRIKAGYTRQFDEKFGQLFKQRKTVALQIRRTDYLSYGKRDISLPVKFFKDSLAGIEDIDNCNVIFCSDDIEFVKANFPSKPNYLYSDEPEIIDFQILMNADVAIISNSSFGWWAAYLSPKPQLTIAPTNWMGFTIGREHPKGVMTKKFRWYPDIKR